MTAEGAELLSLQPRSCDRCEPRVDRLRQHGVVTFFPFFGVILFAQIGSSSRRLQSLDPEAYRVVEHNPGKLWLSGIDHQSKNRSMSRPVRVGNVFCFVPSSARTYTRIFVTTPDPTVLPPSRIAKRRPSSMATGIPSISSTVILTLSPGMHISTPSGSVIEPVTSVVRK